MGYFVSDSGAHLKGFHKNLVGAIRGSILCGSINLEVAFAQFWNGEHLAPHSRNRYGKNSIDETAYSIFHLAEFPFGKNF